MELKGNRRSVFILIIILINISCQIQAKEILCLLGIGTDTAQKWNKVLLTELSAKGHDLTVITPSMWDLDEETNINFIHLENTHRFLKERYENNKSQNTLEQSNWKLIVNWYDQHMATCRGNLESIGFSEALHMALKGKRSFDLIVYDVTYGPGCLLHMAYFYDGIPIVGITSSILTSDILNINQQSSILNAALDPYTLSDFDRNMNFWRRLYNTALYGFDYLYRQWVVRPVIEGLWSHNRHAKNIKISKSLNELMPRFKVFLVNHHPVLHTLTSLPANIIPVPGLHIKTKQFSKFKEELLKFIENSKTNVVLIDLELNQLENDHIRSILDAIRKFPKYNFIWKTSNTNKGVTNSKPSNLFVENNLENQELLSLTKDLTKIEFVITTPDILNIQECLHYGIPMLTVTLKPEQRYLAQRIVEQGFGINLQLSDLIFTTLHSAFEKLLNNPNLSQRAQLLQQSFKNQQNPSLDTAIWWIENLLENPQAYDHLITDKKNTLGFISRNSFDIILLFEIFILMCIINTILVCRQTIQNFKKMSKDKRKSVAKKDEKLKKLKKDKKEKVKTS